MNGQKYIALHMNFKNITNTKWTEYYILSEVWVILEIYSIEDLYKQWNANKHSLSPVALYLLQVHFDPILSRARSRRPFYSACLSLTWIDARILHSQSKKCHILVSTKFNNFVDKKALYKIWYLFRNYYLSIAIIVNCHNALFSLFICHFYRVSAIVYSPV